MGQVLVIRKCLGCRGNNWAGVKVCNVAMQALTVLRVKC